MSNKTDKAKVIKLLKLDNDYRVVFEPRNFVLEKFTKLINRKTKDISYDWRFVGYHGTLESALNRYVDEKILDQEEITQPELMKILDELRFNIQNVAKRSNIQLEEVIDE